MSGPDQTATAAGNTPEEHPHEAMKREKDGKTQERKERAVREREAKVRADLERLEADIGRSRVGLSKEESEQLFRCAS